MGDEIRVILGIRLSLSDGPGPGNRLACLDSGKTSEPGQQDVAIFEHLNRGLIVACRDKFDGDSQLPAQIIRKRVELFLKFGAGLIGNGGEAKNGRLLWHGPCAGGE